MIVKRMSVSKRRICYVNTDTKTLETSVAFFEKRLKILSEIELVQFSSLERLKEQGPCDLIIINATYLDEPAFLQWLPKIFSKLPKPLKIPSPTLFLSTIDFKALDSIWKDVYQNNFYFDILNPEHMDSLPIRVANLLRIHDHLHEINRYETELSEMNNRIHALEALLPKKSPS